MLNVRSSDSAATEEPIAESVARGLPEVELFASKQLASAESSTEGDDSAPRLALLEKCSFGQGDIASNLTWTMVGGFILYYYTNIVQLPVAALGSVILVSRGLDAIIDPLIGMLMDRTRTRFGRARPFLLFASIPFGIFSVLVFQSPFTSGRAKLIYAYVTLLLMGMLYSAVTIPYGALMPLMTRNPKERVLLASLRSIGSSVGSVLVTSLVLPLAKHLGRGNSQRGFTLTATIFAVVGTVQFLVVFAFCKERYLGEVARIPVPVGRSIRQLLRNDMFWVAAAYAFVHLTRIGCILSATVYFALLILHAPWTIPFLFGAMSVGSIVSAAFATPYFHRWGIRAGNILALVLALAMYLVMPWCTRHPVIFVIAYFISCCGAQLTTTSLIAMVANSSDHHERLFGARSDGLIFSSISLSTKIGIALGSAVIAYGLSLSRYNPNLVTDAAREMVRVLYYGVPMSLIVGQIVVMLFYRPEGRNTPKARLRFG